MTFEEPALSLPVEPAPPPAPKPSLAWPLGLVVLGVITVGLAAVIEAAYRPESALSGAMVVLAEEAPIPDATAVSLRRLPIENLPASPLLDQIRALPEGREALHELGLDDPPRERIVMLSLPAEEWQNLLSSGRLPEPGKPEVLAGELARFENFTVDGEAFSVVGRIRRDLSPFIFSYVLPEDPGMRPRFESDTEQGWLIASDATEELGRVVAGKAGEEQLKVLGGFSRVPVAVTVLAVLGMALVSIGGAFLFARLLRRAEPRLPRFLRPVAAEIGLRPGLYAGLHVLSYGAWFACMLLALAFPRANLMLVQIVYRQFTTGELEHVGQAYASGDILHAAFATFQQNFFTATLLAGILPSLIIPFWGVFKNLLSFTALGFAMSPIWSDRVFGYTYHSLTIVMELEAYILASFIISVWPLRILDGILTRRFGAHVLQGLAVVASGTVVVAIVLVVAALYEASTLILLAQ